MSFQLLPLSAKHLTQFKKDMQETFQKGAVDEFGEMKVEILPESHIDRSLSTEGSFAYEAILDGEFVGGAVVMIDNKTLLIFCMLRMEITVKVLGSLFGMGLSCYIPKLRYGKQILLTLKKQTYIFM